MPATPWQTEILAQGIWAGAVPRIWRYAVRQGRAGGMIGVPRCHPPPRLGDCGGLYPHCSVIPDHIRVLREPLSQRREQLFYSGGQVSPDKQVVNAHNPVEVLWSSRPQIGINGTSGAIGELSVTQVSSSLECRLTIISTTTLRPLLSVQLTFLSNSNWSDSCRLTSVKRRFNEASMRSCGYAG